MTKQHVTTEVWFSECGVVTSNYGPMEPMDWEGDERLATAISERRVQFEPYQVPLGLKDLSGRTGEDFANFIPDFLIAGVALLVVTQKMRDLLEQFDMGDNQLIEVPFFALDGVTQRPERFWILAVATNKDGLDVENSSIGPEGKIENRQYIPLPNALRLVESTQDYLLNSSTVVKSGKGQVALKSNVTKGADLWAEPLTGYDLLYFSDRLKRGIEDADLKINDMEFLISTL